MKLEALAKESDDPALATLRDRLQSITDKLEGRGEKLDSMVGRIADLTENVKALELWIVTVVQNLQSKYILCYGCTSKLKPLWQACDNIDHKIIFSLLTTKVNFYIHQFNSDDSHNSGLLAE